ncbi:MAG: DUF3024 domain-containing protein [Pseudomonadota bacterium]
MAFSEFETRRCEKLVGNYIERRRPPAHIRQELDFGFRVKGQSVELFEIRPVWRGPPGERLESAIAKTTYVRTRGVWRIFWMRQDLKWHSYEPNAQVRDLSDFLEIVERDQYRCFYG